MMFFFIVVSCILIGLNFNAAFVGRWLASYFAVVCLGFAFLIACYSLFIVGFDPQRVVITLFTCFQLPGSEWTAGAAQGVQYQAIWALLFDSLTIVMLFVITAVSVLVHLYATSYMLADPQLAGFFAFLLRVFNNISYFYYFFLGGLLVGLNLFVFCLLVYHQSVYMFSYTVSVGVLALTFVFAFISTIVWPQDQELIWSRYQSSISFLLPLVYWVASLVLFGFVLSSGAPLSAGSISSKPVNEVVVVSCAPAVKDAPVAFFWIVGLPLVIKSVTNTVGSAVCAVDSDMVTSWSTWLWSWFGYSGSKPTAGGFTLVADPVQAKQDQGGLSVVKVPTMAYAPGTILLPGSLAPNSTLPPVVETSVVYNSDVVTVPTVYEPITRLVFNYAEDPLVIRHPFTADEKLKHAAFVLELKNAQDFWRGNFKEYFLLASQQEDIYNYIAFFKLYIPQTYLAADNEVGLDLLLRTRADYVRLGRPDIAVLLKYYFSWICFVSMPEILVAQGLNPHGPMTFLELDFWSDPRVTFPHLLDDLFSRQPPIISGVGSGFLSEADFSLKQDSQNSLGSKFYNQHQQPFKFYLNFADLVTVTKENLVILFSAELPLKPVPLAPFEAYWAARYHPLLNILTPVLENQVYHYLAYFYLLLRNDTNDFIYLQLLEQYKGRPDIQYLLTVMKDHLNSSSLDNIVVDVVLLAKLQVVDKRDKFYVKLRTI